MENYPLILLFIASAVLNISLAIYGWQRRQLPGAAAFGLAMLLFAFLPVTQAVNLVDAELAIKVLALKSRVELAGIGAIVWLVMVMQLTGYAHLVNRRLLTALLIVPFILFILNWTENPLFRYGYYLDLSGASPTLHWVNGPIFWLGLVYLNAILLTPLYLLWRAYGRISPLSFQQTLALSISTVLPLIVNGLAQAGFPPVQGVNFPFAAGPVMGLIVIWVILRHHLFDMVPIARGLLIESMRDGVLVVDTKNRIVDINPAMQAMIGPAVIGQSAVTALAAWPDMVKRFREVSEVQTEIVVDGRTPQYLDLRISPLSERRGQLTGRLVVVRDITQLKQTEAALRASENNFRQMLESAPDAMMIVDQAGKITLANDQCAKIFGYSKPELLDQPVEVLLPESLRELHKMHRAAYYRDPQTRPMGATNKWELMALRKDRIRFPVEISLSPLGSETGLLTMAAIRDITERKQMEAQLHLQAAALEAAANAIVITNHRDVIEWVNSAFTHLTGYTAEECVGHTTELLRSGRHDTAFYTDIQKTIHAGLAWEGEIVNRRKDGFEYVEEQTITPVRDQNGAISHFIAIKQDITARRRVEDTLRQQNDYLAALHQITLDLLNRRNVDDLLDAIISNVTRLLDAPYSDLDIVEGDEMVTRACTTNQAFAKGSRTRRGEGGVASWQAYDTRQPVVINDYSSWSQRNPFFDRIVLHATIIVPLIIDDHCLGVFSLSRAEAGRPFTSDEVRLTSLFAQQAAMALANAQLYAETQHEIEERKRTEETLRSQNDYLAALHEVTLGLINRLDPDSLLEAGLAHLTALMKTHHAVIELLDPAENVLIQKISVGNYVPQNGFRTARSMGLTGRVWDTGKMLIISNYPAWEGGLPEYNWIKSAAGVPLKVGGQVIGVICVAFDELDRAFKPEETDLLQRFADLSAMALDNARLVAAAVRQSQELSLLHEVRTAIAGEIDLTRIVKRTVEAIVETFGYTLVSLYLREGDVLILQHQVGYEQVIPTIPINKGVTGKVIHTGQPVLLEDVRSDPSFLGALEGIVSEVAVPIFDEGRVVGVLNIESRFGVKLTEADLRLMLALSDQVSVAIGRARLYADLRRNNERLSTLHQVTIDILNQRGLDELLQSITDQAVAIVDANAGYFALAEGEKLVDRAVSPRDFPYQKVAAGKDNSPAWGVFESHEAFITDDFSSLPSIRSQTKALGIKAAVLLPVMAGANCLGVLGTGRTQPGYVFSEEDINFGNLFARIAGVALDNAQLHETLRQESIRDPLTSLFNRRFMEEALSKEIKRADRNARPLAVVMLDLDHFKRINDTFGHDAGDEALRQLSALLQSKTRGSDIVCRYGGEEFALILPDAYMADAVQRMEQLRKDIKQLAIQHRGKSLTQFTGSFGLAIFPEHGLTVEALLKAADQALYQAKQSGRDRVVTA